MVEFEWDKTKENANIAKHGVSFSEAILALQDDNRLLIEDTKHSQMEVRWVCLGKVHDHVMTVIFTYRGGVIRIIAAGYWRRGKKIYEEEWQN